MRKINVVWSNSTQKNTQDKKPEKKSDEFTNFLLIFSIIAIVASFFTEGQLIFYAGLIALIYGLFRLLNKKDSRTKENEVYLNVMRRTFGRDFKKKK